MLIEVLVMSLRGMINMNREKTGLTEQLRVFSRESGADLFGVADLAPARDVLIAGENVIAGGFPRAVSIGMRLCDTIVDGHSPDEDRHKSLYWHHVYRVVTPELDRLAHGVARWLANKGYEVLPVPGSMPYDRDKLEGIFSHKLAAHLAGLGWITKSCLLLTEEFGPRVRLVSVLTDAPLETGSPLDDRCGKCNVCIDACPVGAFTGVEFDPALNRETRFDVFKCEQYRRTHACGLCVSTCPRGIPKVRQRKMRGHTTATA